MSLRRCAACDSGGRCPDEPETTETNYGTCALCGAALFAWDDESCCGPCARAARLDADEPTHDTFGRPINYAEQDWDR